MEEESAFTQVSYQAARFVRLTGFDQNSLEAILANLSQGIFVVDTNDRLSFYNSRTADLIGLNGDELIGEPYQNLFSRIARLGTEPQKIKEEFAAALERLDQSPHVYIITPYPLIYYLQVSLFPFGGDPCLQIQWIGIIRDATSEWAEVHQRTEQLSRLAYQIRFPAATVRGYVTTLLNSHRYWDENERQKFIESMDATVDEMSKLLENLYEILRIETGTLILLPRPTNIRRLVQRLLQSLAFRSKAHSFVIEIDDDLPTANIDSLRIEQVLKNIFDNALMKLPANGQIKIAGFARNNEIVISISDWNIGMPPNHFEGVFEAFDKIATSSNEHDRQAVTGLYIARGLVLAHQGNMWVENSLSEGAKLCLSFPIDFHGIGKNGAPIHNRVQDFHSIPENRTNHQPSKVLVTGDDSASVRLVKSTLEHAEFRVVSPMPWDIMLEHVVTEAPDIAIMDVHLPDSEGFNICARLREFSDVPIILIANDPHEGDILSGLNAGADDFLSKPFSVKELIARVRTRLRRGQSGHLIHNTSMHVGDLVIDFSQHAVSLGGQPVELTRTEYKLLHYLAINAGRVLTHDQILEEVWGFGCNQQTQYLWVNISRLRKKLGEDPTNLKYILTQPGVGYYLQT
jgi:two-component system KDP operon response regulator KdpE